MIIEYIQFLWKLNQKIPVFPLPNHHFNTSVWIPCLTRGPPESRCQYLQQTAPGVHLEFTEQGLRSDIQSPASNSENLYKRFIPVIILNNPWATDGKASVMLLEYTIDFFQMAGCLPYWSLEERRKYLKSSNCSWLARTCFLSELH